MRFLLLICMVIFPSTIFAKFPEAWQFGFQKPATDLMNKVISLHNGISIVMFLVTLFVLGLLFYVSFRFSAKRNPKPSTTAHNTILEVLWTAIPVIILVIMAIPSFRLIYEQEKSEDYEMTVKVIGHQWYWEYEYPDYGNFYFESYMIKDEDLKKDDIRLLTVDNPLVIPANTNIQILITAGDVLHSWAIPSMGIKTDAVPGRLNETWVNVKEPGVYRGQCSEICGTGHGFMPTVVKVLPKKEFLVWVESAKNTYAVNDEIIEEFKEIKLTKNLLIKGDE